MVQHNTNYDGLTGDKDFAQKDTSYSSFWLFNKERDINSVHFKDSFVNFYDDKELLSEFNPTVAKNVISFWSEPNDMIMDPFAGRTRALVSFAMGRRYTGYEVSPDVVTHLTEKFTELGILQDPKCDMLIDCKDCIYAYDEYGDDFSDLIFSCPPYWDLEKYQSAPGQLSDIKKYETFLEELKIRLESSLDTLKLGKYIILVVGDFRRNGKYIPFHADMINMFQNSEYIKLHDIIAVQNIPFGTAAFYFGASKKRKHTAKAHEYILVWKKVGQA